MNEKLKMKTKDLVNENIDYIENKFPNCITETAEGKAIQFQTAANSPIDIYMGELGVPVYGVVSVSAPSDGAVLTVFVG